MGVNAPADKTSDALVHVRDEKATSTQGGAFTAGAWQTRVLNTVVTNEVAGASLSSNEVTLPAGTYYAEWTAPASKVDTHQTRLYNVTDAAEELPGVAAYAGATENATNDSGGSGRFTITSAKALRLEHRCSATKATNGFGVPGTFASVEVYADLRIWKVDPPS